MNAPTIIIGCGGREWTRAGQIVDDLERFCRTHEVVNVVHGGARGADMMVGAAARRLGLTLDVYPARWDEHGRSAGFRRNQLMLDLAQEAAIDLGAEVVVLGWKVNPDLSLQRGGTEHMLRLGRDAGCRVHLHDGEGWHRLRSVESAHAWF